MMGRWALHGFLMLLAIAGGFYLELDLVHRATALRLQTARLTKELRQLEEENVRLAFQLDQLESPARLMALARQPQFSHLKAPVVEQVWVLPYAN
jgi:cell division protein FtsB